MCMPHMSGPIHHVVRLSSERQIILMIIQRVAVQMTAHNVWLIDGSAKLKPRIKAVDLTLFSICLGAKPKCHVVVAAYVLGNHFPARLCNGFAIWRNAYAEARG